MNRLKDELSRFSEFELELKVGIGSPSKNEERVYWRRINHTSEFWLLCTESDLVFLPQAQSLRQMGLDSFMECLIVDPKQGDKSVCRLDNSHLMGFKWDCGRDILQVWLVLAHLQEWEGYHTRVNIFLIAGKSTSYVSAVRGFMFDNKELKSNMDKK